MNKVLLTAIILIFTQLAIFAQLTGPNPTEKFNGDNLYNPVTIRNPVLQGERTGTIQFNGWLTPFGYVTGAELTTIVSAQPVGNNLPLDFIILTQDKNRFRVGSNGSISVNSDDLPAQFSVTQYSDQNPASSSLFIARGGTSHNIKTFQLFTDASQVLNAVLEGNIVIQGKEIIRDKLFLAADGDDYEPVQEVDDYRIFSDGGILCTEVRILYRSNWPDYVFHDNYQLLPLSNLKKYIDANGHLPNVPSANDIKKKGIYVAETQKILLEKIEEMTLYILQQQEEIEAMKKDIVLLKASLK